MPDSHLVVADTRIHQDDAGRFSLNDLHYAAGGESKHTPGRFTATQQFRELAEEISRNQDIPASISKPRVGTYVAKELVYAYAMWISPAFHLKVIRAYDALVTRPPALDPAVAQLVNLLLKGVEAQLQGRLSALHTPQQATLPGLDAPTGKVRLHVELPADLHSRIKMAAAASRATLKAWVIEACRRELSRGAA